MSQGLMAQAITTRKIRLQMKRLHPKVQPLAGTKVPENY